MKETGKKGMCDFMTANQMIDSLDERHRKSIRYALQKIETQYADDIRRVVLFGSCARRTQKYESDVDLLLYVRSDLAEETARQLKFGLSPENFELPEVQGIVSRSDTLPMIRQFTENIKKEGIVIWEKN